jgi:hypothetical protein
MAYWNSTHSGEAIDYDRLCPSDDDLDDTQQSKHIEFSAPTPIPSSPADYEVLFQNFDDDFTVNLSTQEYESQVFGSFETNHDQKRWYSAPRSKLRQRFGQKPWMLGLYIGFYSSLIVLIGNSAFLAVALQSHQSATGAMRALVENGPDRTRVLSTVYHILINFCSTILLTSSNYAMQILSAPTRDETNQAHVDGGWLEIGTMSLHNLWHIRRMRTVLWLLFAISSLPLHLL